MIRHMVLFNAKNAQDIAAIEAGLGRLAAIGHAQRFEVARNMKCDDVGNAIDVVVYAEFEDEAALRAYKNHPIYHETIAIVRPLRDLRFAADIKAAS